VKVRKTDFSKHDRVERITGGGIAAPFGRITQVNGDRVLVWWDKRLPQHKQVHTWVATGQIRMEVSESTIPAQPARTRRWKRRTRAVPG
jgi:hypothetical protein